MNQHALTARQVRASKGPCSFQLIAGQSRKYGLQFDKMGQILCAFSLANIYFLTIQSNNNDTSSKGPFVKNPEKQLEQIDHRHPAGFSFRRDTSTRIRTDVSDGRD